MRFHRISLYLLFTFCSACVSSQSLHLPLHPPIPDSASPSEALSLLVQQYLASGDPGQSKQLLDEIQTQKGVTVEQVEEAIRQGGPYPPEPKRGSLHLTVEIEDQPADYALYVPESYDPANAYPLIVCLHGAGFTGDSYLERWQPRLGEKSLLACPTIQGGAWWSPAGETLVLAVIDAVQSKYRVDPNRIYLTGMSNGGIGAYLSGIFHADRFAAVAPMAAGIPDEIFPFLRNLSSTGIYIVHGAKDEVMPVMLSRNVSAYLKEQGIPYVYREHDRLHPMAGGHFFPREELPDLVAWFEGQQRQPYPMKVVSIRDTEHLIPFYWTEINETEKGIASVYGSIFDKEEAERVKEGSFASLIAEIKENRVAVKTERVARYTLYFNRQLIDFSKPVTIDTNGRKSFEGRLSEGIAALLEEAKRRRDPGALYPASVTINVGG
ncbi:MAG: PHB depolymerase family esterase [Candidatus Manganitrophaceae bacterium]